MISRFILKKCFSEYLWSENITLKNIESSYLRPKLFYPVHTLPFSFNPVPDSAVKRSIIPEFRNAPFIHGRYFKRFKMRMTDLIYE